MVTWGTNLAGMVYGRTSTNDPFLVLFDGTRWPPESILASILVEQQQTKLFSHMVSMTTLNDHSCNRSLLSSSKS
jgi:hypothetical protein